jgi:hypothetical protein
MTDTTAAPALTAHGASPLPSVDIESCNVELEDEDGLIGDRASSVGQEELGHAKACLPPVESCRGHLKWAKHD